MGFNALGLTHPVLEGVKAMGYIQPTPIQLRAIPLILDGKDVIGSAQTGTGKTAAFALPILSRLQHAAKKTRALVLEPTRELAAQVETAIRDLARFTDIPVAVVFGGVGAIVVTAIWAWIFPELRQARTFAPTFLHEGQAQPDTTKEPAS